MRNFVAPKTGCIVLSRLQTYKVFKNNIVCLSKIWRVSVGPLLNSRRMVGCNFTNMISKSICWIECCCRPATGPVQGECRGPWASERADSCVVVVTWRRWQCCRTQCSGRCTGRPQLPCGPAARLGGASHLCRPPLLRQPPHQDHTVGPPQQVLFQFYTFFIKCS